MTKYNQISHLVVKLNTSFENFTQKLEEALGRFDAKTIANLSETPEMLENAIKKMEGYEGLMLFDKFDHGAFLTIANAPRKAIQYVIGNPLIASTMTRYDIRAGLYAPLRAFVYTAKDNELLIEYDLPSDLFGQFNNDNVTLVGKSLDAKLEKLIKKADSQD